MPYPLMFHAPSNKVLATILRVGSPSYSSRCHEHSESAHSAPFLTRVQTGLTFIARTAGRKHGLWIRCTVDKQAVVMCRAHMHRHSLGSASK